MEKSDIIIESPKIPKSLGIILDGNRRWAKKMGKKTFEGHKVGAENFKEIALYAFDSGIETLTAYVFSKENWSRAETEVKYLMKLLVKAVELHLETFNKRDIKIVILGSRIGLSKTIIKSIENTELKTANNKSGKLALCFNYGGQAELVDAVKNIVKQGLAEDEITEATIYQNLYQPEINDLDMIIRTSGEQRLSGFMLWRSTYSELYFTDHYWPEFTANDFDDAMNEFASRKRRFGK